MSKMDLMFDSDQVQINNVQAVSATFLLEFSSVCSKIVLLYLFFVSLAYGNVSLALVKYSNEGGPGPRYNMKEGSRVYPDHAGSACVPYAPLLRSR